MSNRLYPKKYAPFEHEPDRNQISVVKTGDKGEGLITRIPFQADRIVFAFTGDLLTHRTLFTLQIEPGKHIHDPFVMGKVLHSCEPNMSCDMSTLTFTALRNIEAGEYLTMDYETTEAELYRQFQCCCGSPVCRGLIRGYIHSEQGVPRKADATASSVPPARSRREGFPSWSRISA